MIQIIIFSGCLIFEPPMKVTKAIYKCDNKYHINDIIDMYDNHDNHGIMYTDGEKCVWYKLQNNIFTKMKEIKFKLQNQFKCGGYSANRLARNRDIQRNHYITEISKITIDILKKINPKIMLLCGPGIFKVEVMTHILEKGNIWSKNINIKSLTICDDDFGKMCDMIKDTIYNIDNDNHKNDFEKIQDMITMADDRLVFGKDTIMKGLNDQIISTLFLHTDYLFDNDIDIGNLMTKCKKLTIIRISNMSILDYGGIIGIKYF